MSFRTAKPSVSQTWSALSRTSTSSDTDASHEEWRTTCPTRHMNQPGNDRCHGQNQRTIRPTRDMNRPANHLCGRDMNQPENHPCHTGHESASEPPCDRDISQPASHAGHQPARSTTRATRDEPTRERPPSASGEGQRSGGPSRSADRDRGAAAPLLAALDFGGDVGERGEGPVGGQLIEEVLEAG